jgi:predicted nucleic acid-binding protein
MSKSLLIADTGPLIALAKLGQLDLPRRLFRQLLVPEAVFDECLRQAHLPDALTIRDALAAGTLIRVANAAPSERLQRFRLDPGETAALAVAESLAVEVLLDERLGRRAAQSLGLPVIGVCGLLLLGKKAGHITHLAPLLDHLNKDCGYFLARNLRAGILAAAGETEA